MIFHVHVTHLAPWWTVQQVTHVSRTPCKTPVTVRAGAGFHGVTVMVACGRRLPVARQCPACRHTLIIEATLDEQAA